MKLLARCLLAAGATVGATLPAPAAVEVWVGPAGTNNATCGASSSPCRTIEYGVGRAASGAGDTVRVLAGTYRECIGLTIPIVRLTIVADAFETGGNRAATVIDGAGICDGTGATTSRPTVTLGDGSEIRGFTVKGGGDSGVRGLGSVVITRNIITGNTGAVTGLGGGVQAYSTYTYPSATPLKIEYNDVLSNSAPDGGGGIFVRSSGRASRPLRPVSIKGNVVRNNTTTNESAFGAGIFVRTIGAAGGLMGVTITQNSVEGNSNLASTSYSLSYGGGIAAASYDFGTHTIDITNNSIKANQSGGVGGGAVLFTFGRLGSQMSITASGNTVEQNTARDATDSEGYGGGVWAETFGLGTETIEITGNTVRNNVSRLDGGGIAAWAYPSTVGAHNVSVKSNTVTGNTADNGGGVQLYLAASDLPNTMVARLSAEENTISGNTASGEFASGGGLYALHESLRTAAPEIGIRIERNTITGNTSGVAGGGVLFWALADADPDLNGDTAPTEANIHFANNLVSGNQARDTLDQLAVGGGVFAYLLSTGPAEATVRMDFNTFSGNTADEGAGGIEIESETYFDELDADEGLAVLEVTNSIVSGNTGEGISGPEPGFPGTFTQGGTGRLDLDTIAYNDFFANSAGNYTSWIGSRTGLLGNISADPRLDANGKPGFCSPAVDSADPAADFSAEPPPNGGRANMGHLGGTDEATTALPDVNGDDLVDGVDVLRIAVSFASSSGEPRYLLPADVDADGQVDGNDLALVASKFGAKCQ